MATSALATVAAATAAGYKLTVTDSNRVQRNGTSEVDRYTAELEIPRVGDADGGSGAMFRATGVSATSTTAKTQALASLNGNRLHRYGADSGQVSKGKRQSAAMTVDKN